jgi:hypothetical protein
MERKRRIWAVWIAGVPPIGKFFWYWGLLFAFFEEAK